MGLSYVKNKNNRMYFIEMDGIRIVTKICERLNITLEQFIEVVQTCNGKYSSKYGWFLPNEESATNCVIMLSLL